MASSGTNCTRRYKYYEILEIGKGATQEEIRKAFRRLAQTYHPDRNPDNSEAEAKFKKINEAYQVLSDLVERTAYDTSLAECPACWTHDVTQVGGCDWRCRRCGCQFDTLGVALSETIERAAIPALQRLRLAAFQSMQCSWCQRFYTQPFLCPHRLQLHSNCFFFSRVSADERGKLLDDDRWWWRIVDLVMRTENDGIIKKCVQCGSLNPNPDKLICWNCNRSIHDQCPSCGLPTLYYDLRTSYWQCSNNYCSGKRFTFDRGPARHRQYGERDTYVPQDVTYTRCRGCGHSLRFDQAMLFWRCTNRQCRRIHTYAELRGAGGHRSTPHSSTFTPRDSDGTDYDSGSDTDSAPTRTTSQKTAKAIIITLVCILAVVALIVIAAPFGPSVSVTPADIGFAVEDGQDPPPQILEVRSSKGAVTWAAVTDVPWLSVEPTRGSTDGETSMTLSARVSDMYPGRYSATVTISAPGARRAPPGVSVSLIIVETKETLAIRDAIGGDTTNVEIYYQVQPSYTKGPAGTSINLVNNNAVGDPTWQELLCFIESDDTQTGTYVEGFYMCGSFAERLHNNAEQAGIRAAWVAVHFADRVDLHALNAFYTVDRGLVFVDCTGGGFDVITTPLDDGYSYDVDHNKVAYIRVGDDYGIIGLNMADSPAYDFYQDYSRRWQDYELGLEEYSKRVEEYHSLLRGRTVIHDSSEYLKLKRMYDELQRERAELEAEAANLGEYRWNPLGAVSRVEIYW